jgi:hypothetical protein
VAQAIPFADALEPEIPRVIEFSIAEDGSGHLLYSNGTILQFHHNFLDPGYLYQNKDLKNMKLIKYLETHILHNSFACLSRQ